MSFRLPALLFTLALAGPAAGAELAGALWNFLSGVEAQPALH